jgi:ketosteroid isomerase-like protein
MSDDRVEKLKELYADWGRGDYSRTDFLHPEFELMYGSDFLDEGDYKGQAEAARGWQQWLSQWSFWSSTATGYEVVGERVLVLIDVKGIAKSSGIELGYSSANVWEFRDGMPWRLTLFTQPETARRELGLDGA